MSLFQISHFGPMAYIDGGLTKPVAFTKDIEISLSHGVEYFTLRLEESYAYLKHSDAPHYPITLHNGIWPMAGKIERDHYRCSTGVSVANKVEFLERLEGNRVSWRNTYVYHTGVDRNMWTTEEEALTARFREARQEFRQLLISNVDDLFSLIENSDVAGTQMRDSKDNDLRAAFG
jgi:hypothetical protein